MLQKDITPHSNDQTKGRQWTMQTVEELKNKLSALEPTDTLSSKDVVRKLLPEIEQAADKGRSISEIQEKLGKWGFLITLPTFRAYLRQAGYKKKKKRVATTRSTRRSRTTKSDSDANARESSARFALPNNDPV